MSIEEIIVVVYFLPDDELALRLVELVLGNLEIELLVVREQLTRTEK